MKSVNFSAPVVLDTPTELSNLAQTGWNFISCLVPKTGVSESPHTVTYGIQIIYLVVLIEHRLLTDAPGP